MKKLLWLLLLAIFLVACNAESDEIVRLEQEVLYLQDLVAELEGREPIVIEIPMEIVPEVSAEVVQSFMDNLPNVAKFLGVDYLNISEGNINWLGSGFVTAQSHYRTHDISITMRYTTHNDDIHWRLVEHNVSWVGGFGVIRAGRPKSWERDFCERFSDGFTMRIYRHLDNGGTPGIYEYYDVIISPDGWREQVIANMAEYLDIRLADLWFEGNRLIVDLTPATTIYFNWGSTGGHLRTQNLIRSLAGLPSVTEIEVLVSGRRGVEADHFSFRRIFN
ncbi:MAG: hypothetical protein FWD97_04620 [Defluviitaleaceae bacterium]|nr:hypothetical protein [Defluviitaleaceae bacterium]